jgi:hypothetical protein
MASSHSSKLPRTELEYHLAFKRWDAFTELGGKLIQWSGLVAIAYCAYLSSVALAGKTTLAEIGVKVLGNLTVSRAIISLLAGSGWAYGLGQRRLRRRNIERLGTAKNELERRLDKKRTSSNLTSKGTTPKRGKGET